MPSDARGGGHHGRAFDVGAVAARAGAPHGGVRDALRRAARAGLLVPDSARPERFAFRHGLIRMVLLAA